MFLIGLFIGAVVIGALGRLAAPGPNPIGFWWTVLCGLGGSLIGGLIGRFLVSSGLLVFLFEVAAAAALVVYVTRRRRTDSARRY